MRPGQFCPGCGQWRPPSAPALRRFNEAGAILPRMRAATRLQTSPRRRFNEAGAILPRMPSSGISAVSLSPCFNEAGAILPRMQGCAMTRKNPCRCFNEAGAILPRMPDHAGREPVALGASMRPGQFCPGCGPCHASLNATYELQ